MSGHQLCTRLLAAILGSVAVPRFALPDKQATILSAEAFARASAFINHTARPLERSLFAFHFAHGNKNAVIAELAKFQNSDGGFASYLERDVRWHGSSPMATRIGLGILNEVDAPAADMHVQRAVQYLRSTFDYGKGYWHALPREVNTAPHAPWWHFDEKTGKCEVESPVFPTAAITGYLQGYSDLLPNGFLDRITKSSLDYLSAAPMHMQMSDAEMLAELVRVLPPDRRAEAVRKLQSVVATILVRDPQQWGTYNAQPLMFIQTPDSPLYPGLENEVAVQLDYIIANQQPDGGWALNWSWERSDPAAWELAKKEWRGTVALENLRKLEAFHRLMH